ncbi:hypothetical protein V6N13_145618 [Hibiscus sabdariffa]|uniref:DUF7950 domain-containing protein n=1 Tax=Hibiscus sabdariffa TaxID=183260 RepID=A0ABR2TQ54_9ROSI
MNGCEKWSMIGYSGGAQDKSVINSIMLRFRPIAPKPVSGESSSDGARIDNKNLLLCKPRAKRKYVRVRKNNTRRKKRSSSDPLHHDEASKNPENIVTLQLLPEKTEGNGSVSDQNGRVLEVNQDPLYVSNSNFNHRWVDLMGVDEGTDRTVSMSQRRKATVVESWVTVESVTESCMEVRELGSTDVERIKNLEADTCPGFISDGLHRVQWVNGAYKRMLMVEEEEGANDGEPSSPPPEIMVRLVLKQELPRFRSAFSCKVRLQYMWQKEKLSRMLPCDVWKMEGGGCGFAWRLDVEAALSLGR